MTAADLPAATAIFRQAFGTEIGMRDASAFWHDRDFLSHRLRARPDGALTATIGDRIVGSNIVSRWGNTGWFGPLTVDPNYWGRGVGQHLLDRTMQIFAEWGVTHAGLFTFADSPKHAALYGRYGFRLVAPTEIMEKPIGVRAGDQPEFELISTLPDARRQRRIEQCRELCEGALTGLDLTDEIGIAARAGDTVLISADDALWGFAVCHCGPGTEAGNGCCYIKFAAVRAGAVDRFEQLLVACESYAHARGLETLRGGVNRTRTAALAVLEARGFTADHHGIIMTRDGAPGYNRGDALIIDDWR